jgi:hypothetical protein
VSLRALLGQEEVKVVDLVGVEGLIGDDALLLSSPDGTEFEVKRVEEANGSVRVFLNQYPWWLDYAHVARVRVRWDMNRHGRFMEELSQL